MNYRMQIQYDGARYRGWQRQAATGDTIQGKLEAILTRRFGRNIEIDGASRTDAGVHALAQIANFHVADDEAVGPGGLQKNINKTTYSKICQSIFAGRHRRYRCSGGG